MKDDKRKEAQICYLNEQQMNDPYRVQKEFTEDLSLSAVRKLIVSMREVCSTTENIPYGNPKAREDLFYVTDKMIRFFEASYIQLRKNKFQMVMDCTEIRQLKVLEKPILKNVAGVPNSVPSISLFGKWLAVKGFYPGNEVTIASGQQRILIVPSSEWEKAKDDFKLRA